MTTAIATIESPSGLKALIATREQDIRDVAGRFLTPERVTKLALVAASRQPKLYKCTPASILSALIDATSLGLDPSGLNAKGYLIPYKNGALSARARTEVYEAKFIPGYRGLVEIALRSGQVRYIDAHVARAGDEFRYRLGDNPGVDHVPALEGGGEMVAAYAVAFVEGIDRPIVEVMNKEQVDAIRKRSRAASDGPWVTDYEEMARKTVLRRICKRLPASDEMERALEADVVAEGYAIDASEGERMTAAMLLGESNGEPEPAEPQAEERVELLGKRQIAAIENYAAKLGMTPDQAFDAIAEATGGIGKLEDVPASYFDEINAALKARAEVL